jgi:hypothetical protein
MTRMLEIQPQNKLQNVDKPVTTRVGSGPRLVVSVNQGLDWL